MIALSALVAAVPTSGYQLLKLHVLGALRLSKDAAHVYLGVGCFLLAVILLRIPPSSFKALLPGLVLGLLMEAVDLRDSYRDTSRLLWVNSVKDLVNGNLLPALLVLVSRRRRWS